MPGVVPDRPPPLARVAGLPLDVLAGLGSPATAAGIAAVLVLDEWLAVEGTALADLLYGPVGGAPAPLRPRLVGLRRALHAGRSPARTEWDAALAAAVPPGTAARVHRWVAEAARRRELIGTLPERLAADSAATVEAVRQAVADPGFRRALVRSSPTLDAAAERWLAGGGPPRRQVLLRLARYLARAATKTSPYGTFTVTGPARWAPSGPAVQLALGAAGTPVTLLELDELLLDAVQRQLLDRPELAAGLPVRVSPGAVAVGGSVVFLGPAPAEPVVTAGCTDAVRTCLQAAGAGRDRAEVVAALVEAGGDPGRAPAYVERLVRLGVLEVCRPVPAGTPDPLLALADRLDAAGDVDGGLAGALRRLHGELVRPVPLADLAGQRDRQRALGREAAGVAAAAGLAGAAATAVQRPEAVAHEHALAAGPLLDCGWPAWRPVLADLAGLRRWSAVHDPALPLRLVLGDWVAARFGAGARVPFVLLHRAVRQEAGGSPTDPLGAALAHWLDAPGGLPGPDGAVPRLAELRALRLAAAAPLAAEPGPDGVLRLPPAALAPGPWPAWVGDVGAATCYVQPLPDGGVVLNTMTVGYGRGRTRLRHLAGLAGLDWAGLAGTGLDGAGLDGVGLDRADGLGTPAATGGPEPVELSGTFGTALDARAPATRREVEYPGTESSRPPADRIPLGALVAEHDPDTGLVRLLDRAGTPVRPVHLGLLVEALLPAAARLLVRLAGGTVLPPGWTDPLPAPPPADPAGAAYAPRVVVGQVTLRRARWLVRAAALARGPGEDDAAHLLRLARWRRRHGVPDRAFLHAGGPGAVTGPVFDKTRKPLYVDWRSGPLAATAERHLRGAAELVAIEEALPDPAAGGRAVELLVDLPGGAAGD